jgi:hypothetical protein
MSPKTFKLYLIWLVLVMGFVCCQILLFWLQPPAFSHLSISSQQRDADPRAKHPQLIYNANEYQRSCSDLFGAHQIETFNDGKCLKHHILNWVSCNIGSVSIDTSKIHGSLGGEPLYTVMNRPVEVEFLNFTRGSLVLRKPLLDELKVQSADPVVKSFLNSATLSPNIRSRSSTTSSGTPSHVTLFVRRTTYANPCMALLSMYNVYVVLQHLLGRFDTALRIIWLDGHAQNQNLDAIWEELFQTKPVHIKQLDEKQLSVDNAIVINTASAMGDEGMGVYGWEGGQSCSADASSSKSPCGNSTLISFRNFVLDRYGVTRRTKQTRDATCRLTFLIRKDYLAHPRSNGRTDRTLANIKDDLAHIQSEYPTCKITVVSFEEMSFEEQLKIVAQSDIFVSVHGAGNIHVLFLPSHASFVEYFPKGFIRRRRFQYLSECLNISYQSKKARIEQTFSDGKISVQLRPKS